MHRTMIAGCAGLLSMGSIAQQRGADRGKMAVEYPLKHVLSADLGKGRIEAPLKSSLRPAPPGRAGTRRVRAGRVAWRRDLRAALAAAAASKKPVMLFQLLGRLDQEFC